MLSPVHFILAFLVFTGFLLSDCKTYEFKTQNNYSWCTVHCLLPKHTQNLLQEESGNMLVMKSQIFCLQISLWWAKMVGGGAWFWYLSCGQIWTFTGLLWQPRGILKKQEWIVIKHEALYCHACNVCCDGFMCVLFVTPESGYVWRCDGWYHHWWTVGIWHHSSHLDAIWHKDFSSGTRGLWQWWATQLIISMVLCTSYSDTVLCMATWMWCRSAKCVSLAWHLTWPCKARWIKLKAAVCHDKYD